MKITLDIPDELAHAVIRILELRHISDDDGMVDIVLMNKLDISVEDFVRADQIVDDIVSEIKKGLE